MKDNFKGGRLLALVLLGLLCSCSKTEQPEYLNLIEKGEFSKARLIIEKTLKEKSGLSDEQKKQLSFELERMSRIEKDFSTYEPEVLDYIKAHYPSMTEKDLKRWENEKSLEYMMIDGKKRYFNRAARNLFRIDPQCRQAWIAEHQQQTDNPDIQETDRYAQQAGIIKTVSESGRNYVLPARMRITYTIRVKPKVVPEGEMIRCWIPYPRDIPERQVDIILRHSEPARYQIAPVQSLQRTIYLEKPSAGDRKTVFSVQYEYTGYGCYFAVDPDSVQPVDPHGELARYLQEQPPHIVFTDAFKTLSEEILKGETNPYRKAQILFKWVNDHTPWASAREYSTIRSLSRYGFENHHGDCGIQGMLFITLCRLNGIPARWQSGWSFKSPSDTMHDWGMIYIAPYGWMPMDAYCGPIDTQREDLKWFYLSGMDSYRLIFNDDYSQPFEPPKKYFRSETVDSQRGEVEWRGGNLYFDQWQWEMDWEIIHEDG
jgi:transglutaminase-like putative cysteine protease